MFLIGISDIVPVPISVCRSQTRRSNIVSVPISRPPSALSVTPLNVERWTLDVKRSWSVYRTSCLSPYLCTAARLAGPTSCLSPYPAQHAPFRSPRWTLSVERWTLNVPDRYIGHRVCPHIGLDQIPRVGSAVKRGRGVSEVLFQSGGLSLRSLSTSCLSSRETWINTTF